MSRAKSPDETSVPIACLLLPEFPIVAHHRVAVGAPAEVEPRAVHVGRGTAARIRWCSHSARKEGVRPGQTLVAARARCDALDSALLDDTRMHRARRAILVALLRCTPRITPDGPIRFWAEPVGPPDAWRAQVQTELTHWGAVQFGLGHPAWVAYTRARLGSAPKADPLEAPLEVLELSKSSIDTLHALGIRDARSLLALPSDALAPLGPEVRRVRRRLSGNDPRGPTTPRLASEPSVELTLETPITTREALRFLLRPAVEKLVRLTVGRGHGVSEVRLTLRLEAPARDWSRVAHAAAPVCQPETLFELLQTMLTTPGADPQHRPQPPAILGFELRATSTSVSGELTRPLLGASGSRAATDVAIARLGGRMGESRVQRAAWKPAASPLSRAFWTRTPVPVRTDGAPSAPRPAPPRPLARLAPLERQALREAQDRETTAGETTAGETTGAAPTPPRGQPDERAWASSMLPWRGPFPWRCQSPPAPITEGLVHVAGRERRIARRGRIQRSFDPWWETGALVVERIVWLEVEGPLLVLARERRDIHPATWEAVAWLD